MHEGLELDVIVEEPYDEGRIWNVTPLSSIPEGFVVRLHKPRVGPVFFQSGQKLRAWVFQCDEHRKCLRCSAHDWGRLPISETQQESFVEALRYLIPIVSGEIAPSALDIKLLGEVRGLFNRILRKDTSDHYTVFVLLGRPDLEILSKAAQLCYSAKEETKRGTQSEAIRLLRTDTLSEGMLPRLQQMLTSLRPAVLAKRRRGAIYLKSTQSISAPDHRLETHQSNLTLNASTLLKAKKATELHETVLGMLCSQLTDLGVSTSFSVYVDAFCQSGGIPCIFEVKTITDANLMSQCRSALAQLYEYRFLYGLTEAELFIVLSLPVQSEWLLEYLQDDRGIRVLWIEDGKLSGPSISYLKELCSRCEV